ncbi:hypothetical protein D3C71_1581910 [compost metagenome]
MDCADTHDLLRTRLPKRHELRSSLERRQRTPHERQQFRGHFRHPHSTRMTLEQRALQQLLEVGNEIRHRRLGQSDGVARAFGATQLGNSRICLQMSDAGSRHKAAIENCRGWRHDESTLAAAWQQAPPFMRSRTIDVRSMSGTSIPASFQKPST